MSRNEHTGDKLRSRINTPEFEENYERIFGKKNVAAMKEEALKNATEVRAQKDPLCKICGKELANVTECAWSSCPKLWEE